MLRDKLEYITLEVVNRNKVFKNEYDVIVERMEEAAELGLNYINVSDISKCVIRKLRSEGIVVSCLPTENEERLYKLIWTR